MAPPSTSAPGGQPPARIAAPAPILGEVVVRLGDRVLDVQHVGQRAEPMVSRAGLFTLGACAVGLGLWLVASGLAAVASSAADAVIRDAASTEDAIGDQPTRGGAAGLGALLILLGVIPLAIAAGRSRPVPTDRYMIGEGPEVNLPVGLPEGLDRSGLPLLLALERQLVLGLVPGMSGHIHNGETKLALADLVAQGRRSFALPAGARCEAALGLLRFEIQAVQPETQVSARRPLDRLYWASNLGSLALIGGVLWLAEPPVPGALEVETVALHRARAQHYLSDETTPPPKPAPKPDLPPDPRNRSEKPAAPKPAAPAPAPAPPELAMIEDGAAHPIVPKGTRRGIRNDHDAARYTLLADEGVDSALGTAIANAQESTLAFRDSAEDRKMWADVLAAPVIERPFGGLELAETERGGGIHDGRKRPAKPSGKQVTIDGLAPAKGPTAEERALARRVFNIRFETPTVRGDLSPHIVLTYVRRQELGLRNCFRDAVGTSDRVGTVIFRLEINASGRVRAASLDYGVAALGDIGPCISKMAKTWSFPAPLDRQPATVVLEAIFSARSY